ncbi:PREDICTED: probable myosin-binding protein 6 isoform X2 [Camelina sativa]|uniref:Probable myosin-binding protein 6 isoform X2 n=1 Tax=Camelina sativa TaxID=90675 RepID=A0ABM0V979_CAMSA|nr:PREDICTED: probable myosin-binding protein 6 isoform X2 [Camelina sativa]
MVERTTSLGVGGNNGEFSGVRETMWAQQELLQKINQELDAEREASSSAASEALSMILRLQGEKAALEMEASQYKRMAEEKMCHAETSLALFEDLIYQKEMEIASLGFQVQAYRCKLLSLGCSDPAVIENRFPENLIFYGDASRGNQKTKMKRNLSSPFDGIPSERSMLLSDVSGESFEEKKGIVVESSLSPREDLNAYWDQIRRIDEHVKEISDSREVQKESRFPLLRRESLSHALVSQVSNTILESAKSDVSNIMEMMKNPERYSVKDTSLETPILSPKNVQDIFEVPRTMKKSLTIISEEEDHEERNVRGKMVSSSNYERRVVSRPPRDTSIKGEHLSLLKEIREQLNAMQSEMRSLRSELHQSKPVYHVEEDRALNSIQEAMLHFWL